MSLPLNISQKKKDEVGNLQFLICAVLLVCTIELTDFF